MAEIRRLPAEERGQLASLLNLHSPADATAAYYALDHPTARLELLVEYSGNGAPRGFLALAQTGLDLFRRLAVPFAAHPLGLVRLLQEGLRPGQPVLLLLPKEQEGWVEGLLDLSEGRVLDVFRLHTAHFQPVLNVLVVASEGPDGGSRFEIRTATGAQASAGTNWRGAYYAEVYLETDEEARTRGFARSVLAAMAGQLLSERRIALYRIDELDAPGQAEALAVGFRRSGERTLLAQAVLRPDAGGAGT
ncbi:MAG TPA: hypothetical protein VK449_03020 [Anaerolineales bacterium]|nr:hypothetical protein [Anaerolineales bacterium]